ncbi:MAG: hypothetical protein M1818_007525 [Claussenomyces sp. TS43310]|nr:MAG: hypothetical protein M1818_007525 [Claussenomyces sp. TS43310]
MEKLRSLLSPGKNTDDEIMYGSGTSSDPVHSGVGQTGTISGEGSHFGSNTRDTPTNADTASSNTGTARTTAGPHASSLENKVDPRADSDLDGSRTLGNSTGFTSGGYGSAGTSGMPGTFGESTSNNPYTSKQLDPRVDGHVSTGLESESAPGSRVAGTSSAGRPTHLGRDAAVGAGGEGFAEHEHHTHEGTGVSSSIGTGPDSTSTATGPGSASNYAPAQSLPDRSTNTAGHHLGHNATAAAGVAAVDEGAHHHRHERDNIGSTGYTGTSPSGAGSSYHGGPTGAAVSGEHGPYNTMTASRLDPNINANAQPLEDASIHDKVTGGGAETADLAHGKKPETAALGALGGGGVTIGDHGHHTHDKDLTVAEKEVKRERKHELKEERKHNHDYDTKTTGATSHDLGRDAAGGGAVGTTAYEAEKHHDKSGLGSSTTPAGTAEYGSTASPTIASDLTSGLGPAPNTTGPHAKDWMNKLDPRVDSMDIPTGSTGSYATTKHAGEGRPMRNRNAYIDESARETPGFVSKSEHPTGRDMDGELAAGAGLTGAAAYEAEKHHGHGRNVTEAGYGSTTGQSGSAGYGSTSHQSGSTRYGSTTGQMTTGKEHNYSRDTAGISNVGVGSEELQKHNKNSKAAEERREVKPEQKEEKKHQGLFGFLHRDKSKKYTQEEEAEFDRQANESHKGRGAAIGGTGVGGAVNEAERHHGRHEALDDHTGTDARDTMKPLPSAPGNNGIGTGEGTQNALIDRSRADYGNVEYGSAGLTSQHHQKWEGGEGQEYAPPGTTLGDKLHGVERNRGVGATTGQEHSRLHKDPPSSHPASQGGMTADGKYIEPGTGRISESENRSPMTGGITGSSAEERNVI